MSIEYKLLKDNNKNPVNDNYFITDLDNKYIIFKSVVTTDNEHIFIDKLKKLIDTKFSAEDQRIAKNNLISFFVNQTNNSDDNEFYSYEYNKTSIYPLMNSSMMKNWSLDNYETKEVDMDNKREDPMNRKDIYGGSSSNRYARDKHRYRYRHTGGFLCHHLIPDDDDLLNIYNNNKPFKTEDEINLMLEYVDKHEKELEIYYAIKDNKELEQFLNKIPFSLLKKQ
jgi:hypothetical protein